MLACHSNNQFQSSAVHWDLAELPAGLKGLKGLQFIFEIGFHHIWDKQPSHHLAGDEDVVDVLVLGLAI